MRRSNTCCAMHCARPDGFPHRVSRNRTKTARSRSDEYALELPDTGNQGATVRKIHDRTGAGGTRKTRPDGLGAGFRGAIECGRLDPPVPEEAGLMFLQAG